MCVCASLIAEIYFAFDLCAKKAFRGNAHRLRMSDGNIYTISSALNSGRRLENCMPSFWCAMMLSFKHGKIERDKVYGEQRQGFNGKKYEPKATINHHLFRNCISI